MVTVLPPPITGQTLATEAMAAALSATLPTQVWAVSKDGPRFWSLKKHRQMVTHLRQAAAQSQGRDRLYLVPDAGRGLMALRALAPMIRDGFSETILHHHAFGPLHRRNRHLAAALATLRGKTHHVVLGPAMTQSLRDLYGVGSDTITELGNSALIPAGVAGPREQDRTPQDLGYLGALTRPKGLVEFMRTVRLLEARGKPAGAVIAGPLVDATLRPELEAFLADDPDNRTYLGPITGAQKSAFFDQIDALIFPSTYHNEAQPLVVLEALAAGRPVLATPCGELGESLPETWLFRHHRFAEYAARQVENWQDDPTFFAGEEAQAQALWSHQRTRDEAALGRLITRLA
jgi:glycosyltransferase involved in cell wall biosynthesis